jgi:hypothetical protein
MLVPWDIHWSWAHQGLEDDQAFRETEPGAIWILNPSAEIVRRARAAAPAALIVLRDQPQGEQHDRMRADPHECARGHMADWLAHIPVVAPGVPRSCLAVCGINEGLIDRLAYEIAVCSYYTDLVNLGTENGIAIAAGAIGNGWPGNDDSPGVKSTRVHWDRPHFRLLLEAIRAGRRRGVGHFLNVHEYYGHVEGPSLMWGWHSGRVLHLFAWLKVWGIDPEEIPVRLGEFGFDRLAVDPGCASPANRGWRSWLKDAVYVSHLEWLLQQYAYWPSIKGAACFGWDTQAREWNGFDIRPARGSVVPMVVALRRRAAPTVARLGLPADVVFPGVGPIVVQPPYIAGPLVAPELGWPLAPAAGGQRVGVSTQEFGSRAVDYSKYGLIGHNGLDVGAPAGSPVVATHPGQCWVYDDPGGYGQTVEVWAPVINNLSAYKTIYAHLSRFAVEHGQHVEPGAVLGYVGATGNATGPHLHFGVKLLKGQNPGYLNWVDPRGFMGPQ